jgi:LysR family glycine cleavage system transcriptional activator
MLSDRLPPLNALRMFLVAAKHLSFTRAAADLNVTHGAVSRQVRGLESYLGVALFERHVRQISLTAEGQQLFAEVSPAMEQIGAAARSLMVSAPTRVVRINARPSFAVRWLIPHLPTFVSRNPGIEPQLQTSTLALDRVPEAFDVAIRRGINGWPPALKVQPFMKDELLVVCAPSLLKSGSVTKAKSLSAHVLLSCKTRRQDWDNWKTHIGMPRLKPAKRLQFDHIHLVLQAALNGLGIALAPLSHLGPDWTSGRLVTPLPDLGMPLESMYCGISPNAGDEALLFVDWLGVQAGKDRQMVSERMAARPITPVRARAG